MNPPGLDSWVWFNGRIVPPAEATVSVFDRGFLYGDGLFETIRVRNSKPFRWTHHLDRLRAGAAALRIRVPFSDAELTRAVHDLAGRVGATEAIFRLSLSRGVGRRGYSPRGADHPWIVITAHPAPEVDPGHPPSWKLATSRFRIARADPLACFKTANKLVQVLARAEAEDLGADEAVLLNTDGHVAEAASSNLFWIELDSLGTPPLGTGTLSGVTRGVVFELAGRLGVEVREQLRTPADLLRADGVFLTLSTLGIVAATHLDGRPLNTSPWTARFQDAYRKLAEESGTP